ncbi:helix-turn-helix transcriptional regulator [Inquilinus sp. CA228]|uniref:helix-turn-helix transcriptional regulator n=1 Tax=Inquilinus sp. CA228 TaxID=3455609 RepID=UPI003F8D1CE6
MSNMEKEPVMVSRAERGAETVALLRRSLRESGVELTGDDRVDAATAARLLGVTTATLDRWRRDNLGPAHYARGMGSARVTYRLSDLGTWIESARFENGGPTDGMGLVST